MDSGKKYLDKPPNPRATANPLSALTFWWILKTFWMGYRRDLEEEDLFEPLKEHRSDHLGDKIGRYWESELNRVKGTEKKASLLRAIMKCFGPKLAFYGILLAFVEVVLRVAQPLFLGQLIQFFTPGHDESMTKEVAYLYAGGIVLCSAINVFFIHPYMMAILHMGMKMRVACCSLIYRKALKLSKTALGQTTTGQVVNLLSNDVNRFDVSVIFIHYLWLGPVETIIVSYFMWREVGWAAIIGVAVMLLFIPLQGFLGRKTSTYRLRTALRTDERVRLMNEIISGIQVIKMYTWEKPFADLVEAARKREIQAIRMTSFIRGIILSFILFTTRISMFASVLWYVLFEKEITAEKVFVLTSYFNILRQTMTVFFPQGIAQVAEALVSIGRLQKFLLYDETRLALNVCDDPSVVNTSSAVVKPEDIKAPKVDVKTSDIKISDVETSELKASDVKISDIDTSDLKASDVETLSPSPEGELGITIVNCNANWSTDSTENTLTDISLEVRPGRLVAVIGPTGAGKTSLLHMVLRELPLNSGTLSVNGSMSYASQEPWMFAGSVRQNILFGKPMVRERYNHVVGVCALKRDFQLLPYGDKTMVGERGISLSGGQRARINLARAVYVNADIYLLDDPLSAVDTHVGKHLFEDCISTFLKEKTCILVTHQLQYLKHVDQIVILRNGRIEAEGTYHGLQELGLDFAKLLEENVEDESIDDQKSLSGRKTSIGSESSVEDHAQEEPAEEAEMRTTGQVTSKVYKSYFAAGGNCCLVSFMFFMCFFAQFLASGSDYWITFWTNAQEHDNPPVKAELNETGRNATQAQPTSLEDRLSRNFYIYVYTAITVACVVVTIGRSFLFFLVCMRASIKLHNTMFHSITRATMWFFNMNSSGRILNRFSKDVGSIDELLPLAMIDTIQIGLSLVGVIVVVVMVNYWLVLPTVLIGLVFYILRIIYLSTSRSVKRLEGITRSPVFSHLNASLNGLTTIRAFKAQTVLEKEFDNHQDLHSSAWYIFIGSSRAFGFWLDIVCLIYITIVTLSFLVLGGEIMGGNVGLAITQAIGLTGMFQWGMRQSAEMENQMTSVERVLEYTNIESEPPLESSPDKKPPPGWPQEGDIVFSNMYMQYSRTEPAILRNLNFHINPSEKVGIVGRTGAGKSSLISSLFRLALMEGEVRIDGIDITRIGLHDLRCKISIIPQEPMLFSGTMRKNLDPFDEYSDHVLWKALEEVELNTVVGDLVGGLSSKMSEGGSNFSVGQRQLVCLARAIVKKNKILVLDEATANVDPQTDALIQATIRTKFANCTVLTIAHRLNTVMDSERLLVVDAGTIVEFDHPHVLLQNTNGFLYKMVEQTGKTMEHTLHKMAELNFKNKKKEP